MNTSFMNIILALLVYSYDGLIEVLKDIYNTLIPYKKDGVEEIGGQKVFISHLYVNNKLVYKYSILKKIYAYIEEGKITLVINGFIFYLYKNKLKVFDYKEIYKKWDNQINRCYRPTSDSYKNYGAKGIGVCDEWRLSPEKFIYWSITEGGYFTGAIIDRKNNSKGYYPNNIIFSTNTGSIENREITIKLTIFNDEQTLNVWAQRSGYKYNKLYYIYKKYGEEAVKKKIRSRLSYM